jgi:alkanesulfonate monooxygenase SsuD/methylene tetrahydromethanopterin reductase-like flavin-dependent oxidoreductase (luciferase family)
VGDEDEVADRIKRYEAAGVDRLIISPISPEPDQRLNTVRRLAELAGVPAAA